MEHNKAWLWRKKSTEKTVNANNLNLSSKVTEKEVQSLFTDKVEMGKDLKILNDKLSSAIAKCDAKDELVKKHANMAQEALEGWEKAEAVAVSLKQELDVALQEQVAGEERLMHLEASLKECMQQLRFVREEQEKRIHDAVTKISGEFERTTMVLEEELAETNKKLGRLGFENTYLSQALLVKEKLIEDLTLQKTRAEVEYNALMARLDFTEKDNAYLTYEVRLLEKELEIRNEEREFNQRTGDASHRQHLDGVKRIAKLESECQRLRLLIRKRLPGPATLAKMKNEVEMMGTDSDEIRRMKLNTIPVGLMKDFTVDNSPDTTAKRINLLTEQLSVVEAENKTLKENLNKKLDELQVSRVMYARAASKLAQVESRLAESSKGHAITDITSSAIVSRELSLASMSDIGSDDKVSCMDSWGSALISELDHLKNGILLSKIAGVSDITLMDDFIEMEKLAIDYADESCRSSHAFYNEINATSGYFSEALGRETVPEYDRQSDISDIVIPRVPGWLQHVIKVILKQIRATQRKPNEILEDIRVAISNSNATEFADARESSDYLDASNHCHANGCISWTIKSPVLDSSDSPPLEHSNLQFHWSLKKSISKIIELIEGIRLPSSDHDTPESFSGKEGNFLTYNNSETPTGYVARVFQWKTSDLNSVLQQFINSCKDLLNGKANLEKFVSELTSALDWIINHCFSLQDVSSMRDAIKKHYGWDDTRNEIETEMGMNRQFSEAGNIRVHNVQFPSSSTWNRHNYFSQTEEVQSNMREVNCRLKDELIVVESGRKALEGRLHSVIHQSDSHMSQLRESEKNIASLQTELETLKKSKGMAEDQAENHKLMNEDIATQFTVAGVELNEACGACQSFASVENELENRNNCCEELEATCLELPLQLESVMKKETPNHDMEREEKQMQTDLEITTASDKLAECQETILNLGKHLKELASPREASLFDKAIQTPSDTTTIPTTTNTTATPRKNMNQQRSSLLGRMLAEDDAEAIGSNVVTWSPESYVGSNGIKNHDDRSAVAPSTFMLTKKRGGLWRKLLWKRKEGNKKKTATP